MVEFEKETIDYQNTYFRLNDLKKSFTTYVSKAVFSEKRDYVYVARNIAIFPDLEMYIDATDKKDNHRVFKIAFDVS